MLISEIFGPTIQGEGALIGRWTVFVRTGGCDYRCSWCDSMYAVDPAHKPEWYQLRPEAILDRALELTGGQPMLITLSGGNPALQDDCEDLINKGRERGWFFAMETQGSIAKPWMADLDYLVLSPKLPSSGQALDIQALKRCIKWGPSIDETALKFVIDDADDLAAARGLADSLPDMPTFVQPCHRPGDDPAANAAALADMVRDDGWFDAVVLPQLHVVFWGDRRGV